MRQNTTKKVCLIILAIFFLSIYMIPGQSISLGQNGQNVSQSQIPENISYTHLNESRDSLGWVDEAGTLVPLAQDHFVLGADKWLKEDAFHMVVIGDSIAWGAGLEQREKYYYNVANWLQNELKRPVEVTVLAHTGATLIKPKKTENSLQIFINPDLSSWDPTLFEQADKISNPSDVDLILISGGINDINVNKILNPIIDPREMRSLCEGIENPMQTLLIKLLNKYFNSKIIVTSYYPIVSRDTTDSALDIFIKVLQNLDSSSPESKGFNLLKSLFGDRQIIFMLSNNSNLFNDISRLSISNAVNQANQYSITNSKEKRVIFAPVDFPSNRSYGTNESWLWKLTDPQTDRGNLINDHKYAYRVSLCEKTICSSKEKINAIGHPNVGGANEYNRTIINAISGIDNLLPRI